MTNMTTTTTTTTTQDSLSLPQLPKDLFLAILEFTSGVQRVDRTAVSVAQTCRALRAVLQEQPWCVCGHCTGPLFLSDNSAPTLPFLCQNPHCPMAESVWCCYKCGNGDGYCCTHNCRRFALRKAVLRGDVVAVRALVMASASSSSCTTTTATRTTALGVNATIIGGAYGMTGRKPLHLAAQRGDVRMVCCLLRDGGAAVDAADTQGQTAFHLAALAGHAHIVRLLWLQYGARFTMATFRAKKWCKRPLVPNHFAFAWDVTTSILEAVARDVWVLVFVAWALLSMPTPIPAKHKSEECVLLK